MGESSPRPRLESPRWSWRRALRRLKSVRARAALGAALATLLILGAGFVWARGVIWKRGMDDARLQASDDLSNVIDRLNSGKKPRSTYSGFAVVLANGQWTVLDGWMADLRKPGEPFVPPSPKVPRGDNGKGFSTIRFPNLQDSRPAYRRHWQSLNDRDVEFATYRTDVLSPELVRKATGLTGRPAQRLTVHVIVSPFEADDAADAIGGIFGWGLPPAAAFAALIAWLATGRALRPVEVIRSEMAEIGGQALDRRVPVPDSGDEITRLAETTNATLDRLEQALRAQQRFVADASHELRGPLATLRTALEIPLAHPEDVDWPAVVAGALTDTTRLQRLAEDLLLLTSADGKRPAPAAPTDLAGLVEEQMAERAYRTGRPAFLASTSGPALVHGKEIWLERIVRNLLENAGGHARTEVRATVTTDSDDVVLTMADDGPGIPPADRERVFDRFVRLDDARSRATGGTGLGLTIVRDLTTRLGGTVTIADTSQGATFVVRLPRSR